MHHPVEMRGGQPAGARSDREFVGRAPTGRHSSKPGERATVTPTVARQMPRARVFPGFEPHRRLGGACRTRPLGPVGAKDAVHPGADRREPARGQRASDDGRARPVRHRGRMKLLSDEKFRSGVLEKVSELYLLEWWVIDDNYLCRLRDRRFGLGRRLLIRYRRYRDGHQCAGGTAETEAGGRQDPGSADSCGRSPRRWCRST